MYVEISNVTRGSVVCESVELADSFWARFRGLMFRRSLPIGEGMLIEGDGSIHSAFMRFDFDAIFMNSDRVVVNVAENIRPWRIRAAHGAKAVLELPAGEIARRSVEIGDELTVNLLDSNRSH